MFHNAPDCPICLKNDRLSLALASFKGFQTAKSYHFCVCPVQQVGPSCGIAALASAFTCYQSNLGFQHPETSFHNLLTLAKESNWSMAGEMFDATNLSLLASGSCSDVRADVISLDSDIYRARNTILHQLVQGRPVLLAYDCDADFYPKMASGRKAHWALINGFCLCQQPNANVSAIFTNIDRDDNETVKQLVDEACNIIDKTVYFWTVQGKSKLFRTFEATNLLASNFQLKSADPELLKQGYHVPLDGKIDNSLSHLIIALSMK